MHINKIIKIVQALKGEDTLRNDMNLSAVSVLLCVAQNDGIPQKEVSRITLIEPAVLSRIVGSLGEEIRRNGAILEGRGLIEQRRPRNNWRERTLHLTERGKLLIEKLEAI